MPYLVMGFVEGQGAPNLAHRYWRLRVTALNNGRIIVPEIEMKETVGGADVTTTGFAIASSGTPDRAFNGGTTIGGSDYWEPSSSQIGQWIGQDFGDGNDKAIVEMRVFQYQPYDLPQVDVEWSDDGISYTVVQSITYTPEWPVSQGWNTITL